jgi:uroporphyrinogen-III synthase
MKSLLVLTQPWPRVERLADQLWQANIPNLAIPFSKIEPRFDEPLMLQSFDWVVVVSPSAAERVLALAEAYDPGLPMPRFACIGPGTVSTLKEGLESQAWPDPEIVWPEDSHDAEHLMAAGFWGDLNNQSVLVARATKSKTAWGTLFRERRASVMETELYEQIILEPDWDFALPRLKRFIADPNFEKIVWYVSQESIAERLVHEVRNLSIGHVTQRDVALVPHTRIKSLLTRLGWGQIEVIEPGADGLVSVMRASG